MIKPSEPDRRPENPRFSSGPCPKPPGWNPQSLDGAFLGRSHRAKGPKAQIKRAIEETRDILQIPESHRIGIVPASDTGAMEMAMWSLLGQRPVDILAWESFGKDWVADATSQLKVEARTLEAPYGELPDLDSVDFQRDVVFVWNGTTSGVRVPNGDWISPERAGLVICDATSAAFAADLPWDRLDAVTFSWQKALGGEAAHGMLVLSPRAVERLESHAPAWPIPKIFRLAKDGKLIGGIFEGATINTPSMMAVLDYLRCLEWARSEGGLRGLVKRADANLAVVREFVDSTPWLEFLAGREEIMSNTSVCLRVTDSRFSDDRSFPNGMAERLEEKGVAYDIGGYRAAPPGLRIWCGATVETSDVRALMPWLSWAYESELAERGLRLEDAEAERMDENGS